MYLYFSVVEVNVHMIFLQTLISYKKKKKISSNESQSRIVSRNDIRNHQILRSFILKSDEMFRGSIEVFFICLSLCRL